MPYAAFSGPIPSVNLTMVAYPGSYRVSGRQADGAAIHVFTHVPRAQLRYDTATVLRRKLLGWACDRNEAAERPTPNRRRVLRSTPLEMHFPDIACIAFRLSQAVYRPLFELVWGVDFDINLPSNTEQICATPNGAFGSNTTPVALSPTDRTKATNIYDHWGQSLSFLERSPDISPFNSKFDFFLKANSGVTLTADEMAGFQLFNGKGNCNSCHVDGRSTTLTPGQTDTGNTASVQPLFTCHGFANEGLPLNPRIALLYESRPDAFRVYPQSRRLRATEIWGSAISSGAARKPSPIRTSRNGYRLRRRWTAKSR